MQSSSIPAFNNTITVSGLPSQPASLRRVSPTAQAMTDRLRAPRLSKIEIAPFVQTVQIIGRRVGKALGPATLLAEAAGWQIWAKTD